VNATVVEGFQIHYPDALTKILGMYFNQTNKYQSFLRQLQNYMDFVGSPERPKKKHLQRKPALCQQIKRISRSHSSSSLQKTREHVMPRSQSAPPALCKASSQEPRSTSEMTNSKFNNLSASNLQSNVLPFQAYSACFLSATW
jgi:hypothetical protein